MLQKIYKFCAQTVTKRKATEKRKTEPSQEDLIIACNYAIGLSTAGKCDLVAMLADVKLISPEQAFEILNYSQEELRNIRALKEFQATGLGKELM